MQRNRDAVLNDPLAETIGSTSRSSPLHQSTVPRVPSRSTSMERRAVCDLHCARSPKVRRWLLTPGGAHHRYRRFHRTYCSARQRSPKPLGLFPNT